MPLCWKCQSEQPDLVSLPTGEAWTGWSLKGPSNPNSYDSMNTDIQKPLRMHQKRNILLSTQPKLKSSAFSSVLGWTSHPYSVQGFVFVLKSASWNWISSSGAPVSHRMPLQRSLVSAKLW